MSEVDRSNHTPIAVRPDEGYLGMKSNSPKERRAFIAVLEDSDRPSIEEHEFSSIWLPILTCRTGGRPQIHRWVDEVAGDPNRAVDVIKDGKILFVVPPIIAPYPTETKYHNSRAAGAIIDQALRQEILSPIAAERYVAEAIPKIYESVKDSSQTKRIIRQVRELWNKIYGYYGLPLIPLDGADLPSTPTDAVDTPPTNDVVRYNDFEEF